MSQTKIWVKPRKLYTCRLCLLHCCRPSGQELRKFSSLTLWNSDSGQTYKVPLCQRHHEKPFAPWKEWRNLMKFVKWSKRQHISCVWSFTVHRTKPDSSD